MKNIFFALVFLFIFFINETIVAQNAQLGSISGRIMTKQGEPMADAQVYFYNEKTGPPPSPEKYWLFTDNEIMANSKGEFFAELLKGRYYIGALMRDPAGSSISEGSEPPAEGDHLFIAREKSGEPKLFSVEEGKNIDLGVISGAVPFIGMQTDDITAIEGVVYDKKGSPVEGIIVFTSSKPEGFLSPVFLTKRTGADGKYMLYLESGTYYIGISFTGKFSDGIHREDFYIKEPVILEKGEIKRDFDIRSKKW